MSEGVLMCSMSVTVDGFITAREGVWCKIPKVVFSRTLDSVQGNARLAEASVAEEVARGCSGYRRACDASH